MLLFTGSCGPAGQESEPESSTQSLYPPIQAPERVPVDKIMSRPKLILFIIIDTLRADHLGVYGSSRGLTPQLDAFAKRCIVFDRAIATASWTRPSIASMFTSCYAGSIGVHQMEDLLQEDLLTLPELLNIYGGYQCFGLSANAVAGAAAGFSQGFEEFIMPEPSPEYADVCSMVSAEGMTTAALEHLPGWIADSGWKPIFLFLHYVDPHQPYLPHPGLLAAPEPGGKFSGSSEDLIELDTTPKDRLQAEDYARIKHLYAGEVKYCDHWVGELFRKILDLGVYRNQEIMAIITADHGEGLWDHGFRAHGNDLFEEQVRVPLLIKMPVSEGLEKRRVSQPISLVDLAPTILKVCGIPAPAQFQGNDLGPLLRGESRAAPLDLVFSEVRQVDRRNYEAVIRGNRKLVRNRNVVPIRNTAYQAFDLETDPKEKTALEPGKSSVSWSRELMKILGHWNGVNRCDQENARKIDLEKLDPTTLENLKALGYLGE